MTTTHAARTAFEAATETWMWTCSACGAGTRGLFTPGEAEHRATEHERTETMTSDLPEEGQVETCAHCGTEIQWTYDDPDPSSDNPFGLWQDQDGRDLCPRAPGFHEPEGI